MRSVLHIITGLEQGGAESVLYRLCVHDSGTRHSVISLGDQGKFGPLLTDAGIAVTCLNMPRGRMTLGGIRRMWRVIRRMRPDAIQTWMYHANLLGGLVARAAGQRNVVWGIRQGGLDPAKTTRGTMWVHRISARLSRYIPRRIVCCAERARDLHIEDGYDSSRMLVIHNGYDLSAFRPDPQEGGALRAELGLDATIPVIGFVARFHPFKDHANLLQALDRLRGALIRPTCLLVGPGMEEDNVKLASMIADHSLSDQVRLLGPRRDISAIMNCLDIHVMSSASEGFPNVLAEAMACGTPCVSSDVGDARLIVGGTGRIVPPADPAALAEAIAEMLAACETPGWSERKQSASRRISEHFALDRMIDRYHRVWFEELAGKKK